MPKKQMISLNRLNFMYEKNIIKMENLDIACFLVLYFTTLFFWHQAFNLQVKSTRNVWALIFFFVAYFISNLALNYFTSRLNLPFIVIVLLFIPFIISIILVHYKYKDSKREMDSE